MKQKIWKTGIAALTIVNNILQWKRNIWNVWEFNLLNWLCLIATYLNKIFSQFWEN